MRRLLVGAAFAATACILGSASDAQASSHREAPFVTKNPKVDSTDFYMFRSYEAGHDDMVTILANYQPFQDAYGGPNYFELDPEALYEIHIDNNADGVEDLTFQFEFNHTLTPAGGITFPIKLGAEANATNVPIPLISAGVISDTDKSKLGVSETYKMSVVSGDRRTGTTTVGGDFSKPADFIGTTTYGSVSSYEKYARSHIGSFNLPGGCAKKGQVWVGQRREGFAANIGVIFDFLQGGDATFAGAITGGGTQTGRGRQANVFDTGLLYNKNVTTLALEVPIQCVKGTGNGIIGGWTSASMRQARVLNPGATYDKPTKEGGAWVQVSHLGMPLVNEVVIGLPDKDTFSAVSPKDTSKVANYVTHPTLPAIIEAVYGAAGVAAPKTVRADLVSVFATGVTVTLNDAAGTKVALTQTNKLTGVVDGDNTMKEGVFEYLRLNTTDGPGGAFKPRSKTEQANMKDAVRGLGALGCFTADRKVDVSDPTLCDPAGFPNGRRPGDDVVDIALRVVMGALYPSATDAPSRDIPFTDVNYNGPEQFDDTFPYLRTPLAGNIGSPTHPSQP